MNDLTPEERAANALESIATSLESMSTTLANFDALKLCVDLTPDTLEHLRRVLAQVIPGPPP